MTQRIRFCSDKVTHLVRESAEIARDRLGEKFNVPPRVYDCENCGFFHIGYTGELRSRIEGDAWEAFRLLHADIYGEPNVVK